MSETVEALCGVRFLLRGEASPGLLPRALQAFAKRDLTPDRVTATREGADIRAEFALEAMPEAMVRLVAGNLGQIVGVRRVEAMEGRVVRLAA